MVLGIYPMPIPTMIKDQENHKIEATYHMRLQPKHVLCMGHKPF